MRTTAEAIIRKACNRKRLKWNKQVPLKEKRENGARRSLYALLMKHSGTRSTHEEH